MSSLFDNTEGKKGGKWGILDVFGKMRIVCMDISKWNVYKYL